MKILKSRGVHTTHLAGFWRKALAFVALILLVGLGARPARAATTINVHNVTDLMNAVTTVNGGSGDYVIVLDAGTYTLTTGLAIDNMLLAHVTIVGAGGNADGDPSQTIIDGNKSVRVFNIDGSASHPFSTTIEAITIRNGHNTNAADPYGAGLAWDAGGTGGALTLYNCVVSDNVNDAGEGGGLLLSNLNGLYGDTNVLVQIQKTVIKHNTTTKFNGGGITVYDHTPIQITDSTIALNSAPTGGGIFAVGPAQLSSQSFIKRSVISGNQATDPNGADSGGMFDSLPMWIVDTTISGNSATRSGGGISVALPNSGDKTILTNVTIADNHANTANGTGANQGYGGGLIKSVDPGNVVLQNTIVAQNYLGAGTSTASDIFVMGGGSLDGTSDYNLVGTGGYGGISHLVHNKVYVSNAGLNAHTVQLTPGDATSTITNYYTLQAGSPALDGGGGSYIANPPFDGPPFSDQLGVSRLYYAAGAGGAVAIPDIGAVEQFASVSVIANQTMLQGTSSSVSFAVGDTSVSPTVTATSDNQTILPNALLYLNPGAAGAYTLLFAPVGGQYGTVHVTVTASAAVSGITESMASTFTLTVVPRPDLTVTKSHAGNFTQGQTGATYTIKVQNLGPGPTDGSTVSVMDTLPANLTPTAMGGTGWSCTLGALTCTRSDTLAPGSSYPDITLTVNVSATAPASVTNSVSVSGGADNTPGNNSATDPTTIIQLPDLTIAKSHTGSFAQGQSGATYTLTVTNNGNGPTTGQVVSVVDNLPPGLTATAMSSTDPAWSCTVGTLTCTRSDVLAVGSSYPAITVTVNVAPNAAATVTNAATVAGGGEIITNNDSASDPTTVDPKPNLTLAISDGGNFRQGDSGTYTLTVGNSGGANTSGAVTVTSTLPAGLTATTISSTDPAWSCTLSSLTCTRPDVLAAGQSYPAITLTVDVAPTAPVSVTNTANVAGGGELYTADDSASRTTTVAQMPNLALSMSHTGSFKQGQQGATYTITVTNQGGAATTGAVSVSTALPAGLTATHIDGGANWTCDQTTFSCTRSDALAAGTTYPNAITLTVNVGRNAATSLTSSATVSGGGETYTADDTATAPTIIIPMSDLTLSMTHTGSFKQGQQGAIYTITVTNNGGAATTGAVTVSALLPAGLTATGIDGGPKWSCVQNTFTCTRSDALAGGASYADTITLTVNVASGATTPLAASATVSGGGEINLADDTATDSTIIDPASDLTVTSAHTGHFQQGQQGATYALTVNNGGGLATSGQVTVTDTLPSGLSAVSMSGTGWTCDLPTLTCTRSDALNPGASYPTITVTVNVASNAPASLSLQVQVAGGGEVNTTNDTATDNTTIDPASDLTVTSAHAGNFKQGQQGATYTLTVNNIGGLATSGQVAVTSTLPIGLTAVGASGTGWDCTGTTAGALSCTRPDALNPGASYPAITLTVNVASNAPASLSLQVQVAGGGEVNTSNDTFSDVTTVAPASDLTVTSAHTGNFKQGQQGATYTLTANNSGGLATSGQVAVTSTLPIGLTAVGASGTGWDCTGTTAGALSCTRPDALNPGASYPAITLTVNVASNAPASLTNQVQVAGGGEVNLSNDTFSDATTVDPASDLTVSSAHTGNFRQGQQGATYTLTVNNIGHLATSGQVTVTDTLPSGLSAVSMSGTGWNCDLPTLTCTRSDALNPAASYPTITVTVNVAGNAPANVTNQAAVSGGGEVNLSNDTATDSTAVTQVADLTITSSHGGYLLTGQQGATYTLTVSNVGPGPTDAPVTVTDHLPSGLTATAISGTGWTCDLTSLTCTRLDTLAPGTSYPPITVTVDVRGGPGTLTNQATVSGGGEINLANDTASDPTTIVSPPPLIPLTITAPVSVTREASITVSGTASPGAVVTVGGVTVSADAAGTWRAVVSLQEGPNQITATSGGVTVSVTVVRKTTPPTLHLTASATSTDADTVVLTATSDPHTTITIAGQPVSTLTVHLSMGVNVFTAKATDEAGNTATASVTVTRVEPAGGQGPGPGGSQSDGQGNGQGTGKQPVTVDVDPHQAVTVSSDQLTIQLPPQVSDALLHIKVQPVDPAVVQNQPVHPDGIVAVAAEVNAFKGDTPVHQLNRSVTLTFTYDPAVVQQPTKLQIFYFDPAGQAWVKLGGVVDTAAHTITVQVDHFTLFTVMAPNQSVPQIDALPAETTQPDLTVTGTALPSATVSLVVNGRIQSTGSVDAAGRFSLHGALSAGPNQVYVKDNSNLASVSAIVTYQTAQAQLNFLDIQGHWATPAILQMGQLGVVAGYADGTFRPQAPVTRVQFAAMLARLLKLNPVNDPLHFTDNDQIPAWAQAQVAAAVKAGIIAGRSDGSFDPNAPVTRAEVTAMLVRAISNAGLDVTPGNAAFADLDQIPSWARAAVSVAVRYHLVTGYEDSTFRAGNTATRAEAVAMLSRLLDLLPH